MKWILARFSCCVTRDESTFHTLWGCKTLETLLQSLPFSVVSSWPENSSFCDFIMAANSQLKVTDMELLVCVLWWIWFRCNKLVHDKFLILDPAVVEWPRRSLMISISSTQFLLVQSKLLMLNGSGLKKTWTWLGWSWGCSSGLEWPDSCLSCCPLIFIRFCQDSEGEDCGDAVQLGMRLGFASIVVESDSATVVKLINASELGDYF